MALGRRQISWSAPWLVGAFLEVGCGGDVRPIRDADEVESTADAGFDGPSSLDVVSEGIAMDVGGPTDITLDELSEVHDVLVDEDYDCSGTTRLWARVEGPTAELTREFCRAPIAAPNGIGQEWMGVRQSDGISATCHPRQTSFAVYDERRAVFDGEFSENARSVADRGEEIVYLNHFPLPDVLAALGFDPTRVQYFGGRCTVVVHDVSPDLRFASMSLRAPCVLRTAVPGRITAELLLTHFELRAPVRHVTDPPWGPFEHPINCPEDAAPRDR